MAFSGAIRITDLNDYIAPSQACVVALNGKKAEVTPEAAANQVLLQPRAPKQPRTSPLQQQPGAAQLAPPPSSEPVKVTLHDCLACSGCITSAETMLLQHQSSEEFMAKLKEEGTCVVVSVSPQSRAALAAFYGVSPAEAFARLTGWLRTLGVRAVLDVTTGRDLALLETAAEFIQRYRSSKQCSTSGRAEQQQAGASSGFGVHAARSRKRLSNSLSPLEPASSSASAAAAAAPMDVDGDAGIALLAGGNTAAPAAPAAAGPLPMLASACPGWVCYAEKTHGEVVLPYISTAKSPQAIMGTLVKRLVAQRLGVADPSRVYHCSVMPCYDKKLEASRDELWLPGTQVPEVDSCLTTSEVQQLLQQAGITLMTELPSGIPDSLAPPAAASGEEEAARLYGLPGGSGGYADFVFRAAAAELFGRSLAPGPLPFKQLRNSDFQEVVLESVEAGGPPLLRFAICNGFRNIQTLMRKIKIGKCEYDYVEVMACPSGCLNGGGQIKPAAGQSPQALIEALEAAYHHTDVTPRQPQDNPSVGALYGQWVGGGCGSEPARALLHTSYRRREKTVTATISDW